MLAIVGTGFVDETCSVKIVIFYGAEQLPFLVEADAGCLRHFCLSTLDIKVGVDGRDFLFR